MASKNSVIMIDADVWHVTLPGDESSTEIYTIKTAGVELPEVIDQVCQWLDEQGVGETSVVLSIDSTKTFCATISLADLPKKYREQTMMYRLEEVLPVAAEDIVSHFIEFDDHAISLAVEVKVVKPIIEAFEEHGLLIEQVCPSTLLATQNYFDSKEASRADAYIWRHGDWLEIVLLDQGKLAGWSICSDAVKDVKVQMGLLVQQQGGTLSAVCCDLQSSQLAAVEQVDGLQIVAEHSQSYIEAVIAGGNQVAAGTKMPWADFRRNQLAASDPYRQIRRPLNFAFTAAVVLLLAVSGVFFWRGIQYEAMESQFDQQQLNEFKKALPRQQVAAGAVRSRLESEYRGMMRLRGQATDLPKLPSALEHLRMLITLLPQQGQFEIDGIMLKGTAMTLSGQAESLTLANEIASSLQRGDQAATLSGFETELPKTELLGDRKVTFTIHGKPKLSKMSGGKDKQ